jgi:hypothetical protein
MTDMLLNNDTANLKEFIFPLPAFALMGNWNFGLFFQQPKLIAHICKPHYAYP